MSRSGNLVVQGGPLFLRHTVLRWYTFRLAFTSFSFELENILEGDFFQADELPEVLDSMREAREPGSHRIFCVC